MVAPRAWPDSGGAVDQATLAAHQAPPVQRRGPRRGLRPSRAKDLSHAAALSSHFVAGHDGGAAPRSGGNVGPTRRALRGGPASHAVLFPIVATTCTRARLPAQPLVHPGRAVDILNVFTSRAVLRSLERGPPSTLGVFRGEPRGLPRLNDPPHAGGAAPAHDQARRGRCNPQGWGVVVSCAVLWDRDRVRSGPAKEGRCRASRRT
jgi:hypothetical protein